MFLRKLRFNIIWILMVVLSISTFFVFSESMDKVDGVVHAVSESVISNVDNEYEISLGKKSKGIRAMASADSTANYEINYTTENTTIQGGTNIKFDTTGNVLTITLHDTNGNEQNKITFSAKPGYRFTTIEMRGTRYVRATYSYDDEYDETANISFSHDIVYNRASVSLPGSITPEQLDPTYQGNISITVGDLALVTYKTNLYDKVFNKDTNKVTGYESKKTVKYKMDRFYDLDDLQDYQVEGSENWVRFSSWLLMVEDEVEVEGKTKGNVDDEYTSERLEDSGTKYIKLQNGDRYLIFRYNKTTNEGSNTYYYIDQVLGCINFEHGSDLTNTPNIIALWSYEYDTTIKAEVTNPTWKNDKGYLSGVYSHDNSATYSDATYSGSTTFKIYNKSDIGLRFQTSINGSTQSVFDLYKDVADDIGSISALGSYQSDSSWYYVYNYGYEILGWRVYFIHPTKDDDGDSVNELWYYKYKENGDDSAWSLQKLSQEEFSKLEDEDMSIASEQIDDLTELAKLTICAERADASVFVNGYNGEAVEIFLYPVWKPCTFNVIGDKADKTTKVTYSKSYDLTTTDPKSELTNIIAGENGKSCAYLTTGSNNVAKSGDWYYRNIPYTDFTCSEGVISLALTPQYVNNVYRVNLANIDGKTTEYNVGKSNPGSYTAAYLTYADFVGVTEYVNTAEKSGIEQSVAQFYADFEYYYLNKIIYGEYDLAPLNYVFSETVKGVTTQYIYLVYGQNVFKQDSEKSTVLPIYQGDGKILQAWINTEIDDQGNYNYYFAEELTDDERKEIKIKYNESECTYADHFYCNGTDGYEPITLYAYYAEQYYLLDVDTLVGTTESFHGYVIINKIDKKGVSSYYLAISDASDSTSIYKIKTHIGESWTLPCDYTSDANFEKLTSDFMVIITEDIIINIFDQSKDVVAVSSGNFNEMIGYKYDKMNVLDYENKDYSYTIDLAEVYESGLPIGSTIEIDVYFAPIQYTIEFAIDDANAGKPQTATGTADIADYVGAYTTDVTKNSQYTLSYFANVGYEFGDNQFSLVRSNKTESVITESESDKNDQKYTFNFNTSWLRDVFYSDSNYAVNNTTMTIRINTKAYEFDYKLKLDTLTTIELLPKVDGDNYTFTLTNGQYRLVGLNKLYVLNTQNTENVDDDKYELLIGTYSKQSDYIIVKYNGVEYALLKSYLDYNPIDADDINLTERTYSFPLIDSGVFNRDPIVVDSESLVKLIPAEGYVEGVIVDANYRYITMNLDIREMKEVNVEILIETDKDGYTYDSDMTERSVKVEVSNNTIEDGNVQYNDPYELTITSICRGKDENSMTMYTYDGNQNKVTASFDHDYYEGVGYKNKDENITLTNSAFETSQLSTDNTLYVVFIPKKLKMSVVYEMYDEKGNTVDINNGNPLSKYFSWKEGKEPNVAVNYYNYDYTSNYPYTNVSFEYVNKDKSYYTIEVQHDSTPISDNGYCKVIPSEDDYIDDKINIKVIIRKISTSQVTVEYALANSAESCRGDDFGTVDILVNNNKITNGIVPQDAKLEFDISGMATGYEYNYVARNNDKLNIEAANNKLLITSDYETEVDAARYVIYLNKIKYKVELDTENATIKDAYSIRDGVYTSNTALNSVYVGKTITAVAEEQDTEVIDGNFYYEYGPSGNKTIVELPTIKSGKQYKATLLFDATIIGRLNNGALVIKFKTAPKYKLDIVYQLGEGVTVNDYSTDLTYDINKAYVSGMYIKSVSTNPTIINVRVSPVIIGKYDITTIGCREDSNVLTMLDADIEMDSDKVLTIKIDRHEFDINFTDYTVVDLEGGVNTETGSQGVKYGDTHKIEIATDDDLKVLKFLEISGNDTKSIKIDFEANKYYYFDDSTWVETTIDYINREIGYSIMLDNVNKKVNITYIVKNTIDIESTYNDYKNIDQVEEF